MSGRYCEKHEEWAPTGECRWCELTPKTETPPTFMGIPVIVDPTMKASDPPILWSAKEKRTISGAELQQMMNAIWVKMVREGMKP